MSKRFTDTDKWKKRFIRGLSGPYKLLWFYITDDCDHAGIWHVDIDVAKLRIGEASVGLPEAMTQFGDKIFPFDDGEKWFIPSFVEFQYGPLNRKNNAHKSVMDKLNKYDLLERLISPLQGDQDKDMDKDKDMDMDKEETVADVIAKLLAESIHSWKPNYLQIQPAKIGRSLDNWAKDIDLALRIDSRDPEKMKEMLVWLPGHGDERFRWRDQILSGAKLRQQFDKLEIAMTRNSPMQQQKKRLPTYKPTD